MNQDTPYPKLNDLFGGLGNLVPGAETMPPAPEQHTVPEPEPSPDNDDDWELFRKNLALYNFREKKDDRM